jgi:DNA-binding NarL/FixJ family response regulator
MSKNEITVVVHGGDPLSRAGVIEFLENRPDVVVLDELDPSRADHAWSVGLILVNVLDASSVVQLRKLVAEMDGRVVLVVGDLDEPQVDLVLGMGARSVVHLHDVTAARLVKAVEAVSWGGAESRRRSPSACRCPNER